MRPLPEIISENTEVLSAIAEAAIKVAEAALEESELRARYRREGGIRIYRRAEKATERKWAALAEYRAARERA